MKSLLFVILFAAVNAFADEANWAEQRGKFAVFQTPATVTQDKNKTGVDSLMEFYKSPNLRIVFDSQVTKLPASFQEQFERTLAAWIARRKADWKKSTNVADGGGISGSDVASCPGELKYSLYLGFAVADEDKPIRDNKGNVIELDFNHVHSFAITVSFTSLDRLDDVERVLKSIKFTTK